MCRILDNVPKIIQVEIKDNSKYSAEVVIQGGVDVYVPVLRQVISVKNGGT